MCLMRIFAKKNMATLYLVPSLLSDSQWQNVLPAQVFSVLSDTKYYLVENTRTARRFMKKVNREINIDECTFFEINKRTASADLPRFLEALKEGNNMAVISEAGCPGVADPGADIVRLAHEKNIKVVPLTGPSSILLALMASGLNGQNFAFTGYLPIKSNERTKVIANLEKQVQKNMQTQIFIETPYRNNQIISDIVKTCASNTRFCIAANITAENEYIQTKTIQDWRKTGIPDLHKQPAIFLIGK